MPFDPELDNDTPMAALSMREQSDLALRHADAAMRRSQSVRARADEVVYRALAAIEHAMIPERLAQAPQRRTVGNVDAQGKDPWSDHGMVAARTGSGTGNRAPRSRSRRLVRAAAALKTNHPALEPTSRRQTSPAPIKVSHSAHLGGLCRRFPCRRRRHTLIPT